MKVKFLGITGGAASGKTTIAQHLLKNLNERISVLQFDRYYRDQGHLTAEHRALVNYDHPDSLDHELLVKHLDSLSEGTSIDAPIYDFVTHTRTQQTEKIEPKEFVIVDGILIMAFAEIMERLTFKIFIDTPDETRLKRRITRDMDERGRTEESVRKQFEASVLPMHKKFVEPFRDSTQLIIDGLEDPSKSVAKLISFIDS
ncbi:MAG: Uridine kinase [Acidimicrobiaceae bacterium]|nr:MAG: Uridine kinase [Acidimicrobiaceae bacterium]|tara:strand:+ start:1621 stop:2223 length:603 start_codon:yes stop_codon:yes gene_type:complete